MKLDIPIVIIPGMPEDEIRIVSPPARPGAPPQIVRIVNIGKDRPHG